MAVKKGRKSNPKNHKIKNLSYYLNDKCHSLFAKKINISPAHLSMILNGTRKASMFVSNKIILETEFEVTLKDLRLDLYNEIMKYGKNNAGKRQEEV